MSLIIKAGLVCLFTASFWVRAEQGAQEETDHLPINGACNLGDGVYSASLENGNEMSLVISGKQLVQLSIRRLESGGFWLFGTEAVWEDIQFNRLVAGCSDSRWLFFWKGTTSSLSQSSHSDYYGALGVFSGFLDENTGELIVSSMHPQTNNLSVVVGSFGKGEGEKVDYTLTYKKSLSEPWPPISDECLVGGGDFKASQCNAEYFLNLISRFGTVYVYKSNKPGGSKHIQKADRIVTVCKGNRLISSWSDPQSRRIMIFAGVRTSDSLIEPLTNNMRFGLPHSGYDTIKTNFEQIVEGMIANIYGD